MHLLLRAYLPVLAFRLALVNMARRKGTAISNERLVRHVGFPYRSGCLRPGDCPPSASFDPFKNVLDLGPVQLSQGLPPSPMPAFDPFVNSLAAPPSTELPTKRRRTVAYPKAPEAAMLAVGLLEEEFEFRVAASEAFPPVITSSHIRTC